MPRPQFWTALPAQDFQLQAQQLRLPVNNLLPNQSWPARHRSACQEAVLVSRKGQPHSSVPPYQLVSSEETIRYVWAHIEAVIVNYKQRPSQKSPHINRTLVTKPETPIHGLTSMASESALFPANTQYKMFLRKQTGGQWCFI